MLTPNSDQERALKLIRDWYTSDPDEPFVLGGLAGTGKTALLPMLHSSFKRAPRVRYVCPTWKAAHVLSNKLKQAGMEDRATSIHNLLYNPRGVVHEEACGYWQPEDFPSGVCTLNCKKLGWEFDPKEQPELLVVDEASMVDSRLRADLELLGCPVLYVGDHGQLPPVVGQNVFQEREPDVVLEAIQRQALDNPIIPLSRIVRRGERGWLHQASKMGFEVLEAGPRATTRRYDPRVASPPHSDPETVFITSTNSAVDKLNALARRVLERGPDDLVSGDLVMFQNNLKRLGLFNGQLGVITYVSGRHAGIQTQGGVGYSGQVLLKGVDEVPNMAQIPVIRHAYALTCHKAQGSEFRNVVVYLTGSRMEDPNWLYTAVTRSSDRLTFVRAR